MYSPGKLISVGVFGLFCWVFAGTILLWITCIAGFIVLFGLTVNFLGGYIDTVIENMTEWKDD